MDSRTSQNRGFTLMEVLVGFAIGLVVLAGAVQLFNQATNVSDQLNAQGEMQQNARAAVNSIEQDLSLAGSGGMAQSGIALPSGNGSSNTKIACDINSKCWVTAGGGGPITYSDDILHVITPIGKVGPQNKNGTSATDVITIAYGDPDPNFQLDCKSLSNLTPTPATGTPTSYTVTFDSTAFSAFCPAAPSPIMNALLSASDGLVVGDVLALSNSNGVAAGVVSSINESGATHTVTISPNDLLNFNQFGAASGSIPASLSMTSPTTPSTAAFRLWVVTYFLYQQPDGTLRLMRQVNARPAVPVAENIDDFSLTYDTYNSQTGTETANLTAGQVYSPPIVNTANNIRKVNIQLTVRSSRPVNNQYRHFRIETSIAPRGLGYVDRYQ